MPKRIKCSLDKLSQFWCYAPDGREVFLAGDFNDWNPRELAMNKRDEGTWTLCLDLHPGRYEYKFVMDGGWGCGEPGCDDRNLQCGKCVRNPMGTMNHVIEIKPG